MKDNNYNAVKRTLVLMFWLLHVGISAAQTPEQNMMKYWKHREQLSRFVYKGEDVNPSMVHGSYLVAAFKRTWAHCFRDFEFGNTQGNGLLDSLQYDQKCNGLKFGADATIQLGWYIGVLATEYRLLKNHSASTFEVERELWGALKAYERLDLMAETLYDEGEPQLNGFFLRDDIMPFFASDKLKPDGSPYFEGVGCSMGSFAQGIAQIEPDVASQDNQACDPWDVTVFNGVHYRNTPSQDQVVALMLGFALVKACVDEQVVIGGDTLLRLAQKYAHLIAIYGKEHGSRDGWEYRDPRNNLIEDRSNLRMYSGPISKVANWISEYQTDYDGEATTNWNPMWDHMTMIYSNITSVNEDICDVENLVPATFFLNGIFSGFFPGSTLSVVQSLALIHMWTYSGIYEIVEGESPECFRPTNPSTLSTMLTAAAISNDWNHDELRNQNCREWGMEIYPLISDVLYASSEVSPATKGQCKQMIDIAPCDKFCACLTPTENCSGTIDQWSCSSQYDCDPVAGWESMHRYTHHDHQENSTWGIESPGLDFMLLYNCYHLKYPNELPLAYGNSFVGDFGVNQSYPIGIAPQLLYEPFVDCKACTEHPGLISSNGKIISSSSIGSLQGVLQVFEADVTYRAGEEIQLTDGFSVTAGASFHAYIDPFECYGGQLQRLGDESFNNWEEQDITKTIPPSTLSAALFPNPTTGLITYTPTGPLSSATIMDLMGRTLHTLSLNGAEGPVSIDLSSYRPGTYLLRVQYLNGKAEVHRVVRQ